MEQRTVATHHSWAVHTCLGLATAFMGMPALVLPAPATSYWDLLGSSSVCSACAHCIWLGFTAALPGVALCDEALTVDSDSCLVATSAYINPVALHDGLLGRLA